MKTKFAMVVVLMTALSGLGCGIEEGYYGPSPDLQVPHAEGVEAQTQALDLPYNGSAPWGSWVPVSFNIGKWGDQIWAIWRRVDTGYCHMEIVDYDTHLDLSATATGSEVNDVMNVVVSDTAIPCTGYPNPFVFRGGWTQAALAIVDLRAAGGADMVICRNSRCGAFGQAGNDLVYHYATLGSVTGGPGNDRVEVGGASNAWGYGDEGDDCVQVPSNRTANGGSGYDRCVGGTLTECESTVTYCP